MPQVGDEDNGGAGAAGAEKGAGAAGAPKPAPFGDRLAAAVQARQSQIVLGLDPDPVALWPGSDAPQGGSPSTRAAAAVLSHCRALIDAAGPACVAVKPQLACFERLGAPGREALGEVVEHARAAGLLVIADGKRGDIDVTAGAYAQSLFGGVHTPFGTVDGLRADAATANPLMGSDALRPLLAAARQIGAAVFALVRTSNPSGGEVQDIAITDEGDLHHLWEILALLVADLGVGGVGEAGLSDLGAVIGATVPAHLERARELMPSAVLLLPGIGAQGGRVEDLAAAFASSMAGGLISASRSIASAHLAGGGEPRDAARREAERLRALAWSVALQASSH